MPHLGIRRADGRELLLVAGVAAVLIGSSVTAVALTSVEHVPARVAVAAVGGVPAPHSIVPVPTLSACHCTAPRRASEPLSVPDAPVSIAVKAPRLLHAPVQMRSSESNSFHDWLRNEDDPRRILARMSRMANHAPRDYATEVSK